MSVWGKLFGGAAGFAIGGPFGALMGAALGHAADRGSLLEAPAGGWGDAWAARGRPDPNGAAFFAAAKLSALMGKREQVYAIGIVALSAKLCKIDAPVNRIEIETFKRCFQIPTENAREVGRLFDQARLRTDDFEAYGRELGRAYADEQQPLEDLLSALFVIARADSPAPERALHPRELDFLARLHRALGLPLGAWDRAERGGARPSLDEADAYVILGVTRTATDAEIRTRWRTLMRAHHPDVLSRQALSAAEQAAAQDRIGRINAAWDRIKRDRRL
ncbi:TerB family tellurite resistance protein [Tanticharoenia sakaeratensis]|uniref:DnaJ-like protein n=1 Tax=Tanticharoenia sakaeratensis NBRC 103193 TaxID=1231623 RepID=A0A0D6MPN0_9PROT|nr:TerB family tellurite resistance protein [Tanticharoenia sakaeratensis]GAN55335.1 DnaJ-like protein [Tanticharoenia sakaeratensis NBRC 103193]GBQ24610.1 molecular chaperone DnaJ [Tanticharoenia sakaeratensis NBRC 103193]